MEMELWDGTMGWNYGMELWDGTMEMELWDGTMEMELLRWNYGDRTMCEFEVACRT